MIRSRKNNNKNNNQRGDKRNNFNRTMILQNPSSSVTRWNGPVAVPRGRTGEDTQFSYLTLTGYLTSAAGVGGLINNVFSSDPTGALDWSSFANLYTEYRVLAVTFKYCPNLLNAVISTVTIVSPVFVVIDRQSNAVFTGYNAPSNYSSMKPMYLNNTYRLKLNMADVSNSTYTPINSSTPNPTYIKLFGTPNTANQQFGVYILKYAVEFRARQ